MKVVIIAVNMVSWFDFIILEIEMKNKPLKAV